MSGKKLAEVRAILSNVKGIKQQRCSGLIKEIEQWLQQVQQLDGNASEISKQLQQLQAELAQIQSSIQRQTDELEQLEQALRQRSGSDFFTPEYNRAKAIDKKLNVLIGEQLQALAASSEQLKFTAQNQMQGGRKSQLAQQAEHLQQRLNSARFVDEALEPVLGIKAFCQQVMGDDAELQAILNSLATLQQHIDSNSLDGAEQALQMLASRIASLLNTLRGDEEQWQGMINTYFATVDALEAAGVVVNGDWIDPDKKILGRKIAGQDSHDINGAFSQGRDGGLNVQLNLDGVGGHSACSQTFQQLSQRLPASGVGVDLAWQMTEGVHRGKTLDLSKGVQQALPTSNHKTGRSEG